MPEKSRDRRRSRGSRSGPLTLTTGFLFLSLFLIFFSSDLRQVASGLSALAVLALGGQVPARQVIDIVRSIYILLTALAGWLFFYFLTLFGLSSFVYLTTDPFRVMRRILLYRLGLHGPVIHLQGGREAHRSRRFDRRLPGVILADFRSGLTLEENLAPETFRERLVAGLARALKKPAAPRVHVASPGTVFLSADQQIHSMVDLRPQTRQRSDLRACTQDSVEFQARLLIEFTLGQEPDTVLVTPIGPKPDDLGCLLLREVGRRRTHLPHFRVEGLSPLAAELDPADFEQVCAYAAQRLRLSAVIDHLTSKPDASPDAWLIRADPDRILRATGLLPRDELECWDDLPLLEAARIFRDLLSNYPSQELVRTEEQEGQGFQQKIMPRFFALARSQGVLNIQWVRRRDGRPMLPGEEFERSKIYFYPPQPLTAEKPLRARGIKVNYAGFTDLHPADPQMRQERIASWRAFWEKQEGEMRGQVEGRIMKMRTAAQTAARQELIDSLQEGVTQSAEPEQALREVLRRLQIAAQDPMTRRFLPPEAFEQMQDLHSQFSGE